MTSMKKLGTLPNIVQADAAIIYIVIITFSDKVASDTSSAQIACDNGKLESTISLLNFSTINTGDARTRGRVDGW